jgi:hypothetical protein
VPEIVLLQTHYSEIQQLLYTKNIPQTPQIYCFQKHIYRVYNTYYYYYPIIYTTLIIPISYPSQFPQWHKLVSTPEAVVGAHAQSLVEAVILNTLFTTFTFYSHFFFGSLPTHANTNIKMVRPKATSCLFLCLKDVVDALPG